MRLAAVVVALAAVVATVRWRAAVVRELRAIRRGRNRVDEEADDDGT